MKQRESENGNKISEETNRNPLEAAPANVKVSKKIMRLLLSNKLRIAQIKMAATLWAYSTKEIAFCHPILVR